MRISRRAALAAFGLSLAACTDARKPAQVVKSAGLAAPSYSAAGIAPLGASGAAPLAPGRVASIYGERLGPGVPCNGQPDASRLETPHPLRPNQTLVETRIFPATLCGTEVEVGGVRAGLVYVSSGQINFKVPQTVPTQGSTTVQVVFRGKPGPPVPVLLTVGAAPAPAEQLAARMWEALQGVPWQRPYKPRPGERCGAVRAQQALRGGLYEHAFQCAESRGGAVAESFYYPRNPASPQLLLLRADVRPVSTYPELSDEVEQRLVDLLTKAYGAGGVPEHYPEIGVYPPSPGRCWRNGALTIFLHRNRYYAAPAGVRLGVTLIAVHAGVLAQREALSRVNRAAAGMAGSETRPPVKTEAERLVAENLTRTSLFRLLRVMPPAGDRVARAAALLAADELAGRLGSLLVIRSIEQGSERLSLAHNAAEARSLLASLGVHYGEIGHYSGDLDYNHSLLARAWTEYPETPAGQQAFLRLQRLSCATSLFGCDGPRCFQAVIRQGEQFLVRYPDSLWRREQLYHVALANETAWSLAQADPGDISAQGAHGTAASAEPFRLRAIELYERLLEIAPRDTREAVAAQLSLPRLKLKLDTAERTFFCFSC